MRIEQGTNFIFFHLRFRPALFDQVRNERVGQRSILLHDVFHLHQHAALLGRVHRIEHYVGGKGDHFLFRHRHVLHRTKSTYGKIENLNGSVGFAIGIGVETVF